MCFSRYLKRGDVSGDIVEMNSTWLICLWKDILFFSQPRWGKCASVTVRNFTLDVSVNASSHSLIVWKKLQSLWSRLTYVNLLLIWQFVFEKRRKQFKEYSDRFYVSRISKWWLYASQSVPIMLFPISCSLWMVYKVFKSQSTQQKAVVS